MVDSPGQSSRRSEEVLVDLREFRKKQTQLPTTFQRRELDAILRLYSRMVAEGEWRDYAIDHLKDRAVFSVFRRASEVPLFRIEKDPKLARKQGAFSVIAAGGLIVKRGHDLAQVLKVFDKSPKLVRG
jgi:hypothetical protein